MRTAAAAFVLLMSSYTAEGLSPRADSRMHPGACRSAFACNGAAAHLVPAWRSAICEVGSGRAGQTGQVLPRARGVRTGGAGVAQWAMQQQKAGWSRPGELGQTMAQMVKEKRKYLQNKPYTLRPEPEFLIRILTLDPHL